MTKGQRITLMADWWPKACAAQHWNTNDRELRLQILSQAVHRELSSASDLNNTTDIDAVKAHLFALFHAADLDTQVDIANQPRTRLIYAIEHSTFHPNYIVAISRNRFGTDDWQSLPDAQLVQLRNTLTNRARAQRARASVPVAAGILPAVEVGVSPTGSEPDEPNPF